MNIRGALLFALILAQLGAFVSAQGSKSALFFDGVDDVSLVGYAPPGINAVSNSFTMELWVRPTLSRSATAESTSGANGVFSGQRYAVFPDNGALGYGSDVHAGVGLSIGNNGISVFEHSAGYLPSVLVYDQVLAGWHHVAVVYNLGQPTLFVDGIEVRSRGASGRIVHPSIQLGDYTNSSSGYGHYGGYMDEFRVWNRALTQEEIRHKITERLAGTEPGLVAYYRLDEGADNTCPGGQDVCDASGNGNHGVKF